METTAFVYNRSDIETAQPVSVADIVKQARKSGSKFFTLHSSLFTFNAPRIYRAELTLYRRMAALIDRHPIVSNTLLAAQVAAFIYYIFMYA